MGITTAVSRRRELRPLRQPSQCIKCRRFASHRPNQLDQHWRSLPQSLFLAQIFHILRIQGCRNRLPAQEPNNARNSPANNKSLAAPYPSHARMLPPTLLRRHRNSLKTTMVSFWSCVWAAAALLPFTSVATPNPGNWTNPRDKTVFRIGERQNITFSMPFKSFTVALWQQFKTNNGATQGPVFYSKSCIFLMHLLILGAAG